MEQIVIDFQKQITKSLPKGLRNRFEILFAQVIGLQSPAELLRGLTITKKLDVQKQAIKLLDEERLQQDPSYSPVYTPLVNATFNALIAMAKLKSTSTEVVTKHKDSKDSAKPALNQLSVATGTSAKASSNAKSVEPETKGTPRKVKKPEGKRLAKVYADIQSRLSEPRHVFNTTAFKFIKCENNDCTFCRSLFVNFQLTKCSGHRKCTQSGWYPHFGVKLWGKFQRLHTQQKIFVSKPRTLHDDEIASYCEYSKSLPSLTPPHEMEYSLESASDDDTASTSTVTSCQSSSSSVARKREHKTCSLDWADDMEGLSYLSPKRVSPDKDVSTKSRAKALTDSA